MTRPVDRPYLPRGGRRPGSGRRKSAGPLRTARVIACVTDEELAAFDAVRGEVSPADAARRLVESAIMRGALPALTDEE